MYLETKKMVNTENSEYNNFKKQRNHQNVFEFLCSDCRRIFIIYKIRRLTNKTVIK